MGNPEFNGIIDCFKKTISKHGVSGVYVGAPVRIIGAGFQQMFRWGAYTNLAGLARDENGKLSPLMTTLCGLGAGITEAVCAVTPVETLKTRVTDDQRRGTGNYKGTGDALVKIFKSEGPLGLYRGALPTILKQGTNQAVRMPLQVQLMGVITMGDESKNKNPLLNGAAGFLAGCGSVFLTQPQDCVKSRMQGETAKEMYSGTVDCALKMMRTEGPAAFFCWLDTAVRPGWDDKWNQFHAFPYHQSVAQQGYVGARCADLFFSVKAHVSASSASSCVSSYDLEL